MDDDDEEEKNNSIVIVFFRNEQKGDKKYLKRASQKVNNLMREGKDLVNFGYLYSDVLGGNIGRFRGVMNV